MARDFEGQEEARFAPVQPLFDLDDLWKWIPKMPDSEKKVRQAAFALLETMHELKIDHMPDDDDNEEDAPIAAWARDLIESGKIGALTRALGTPADDERGVLYGGTRQ